MISVIIPTYNEAGTIDILLSSLSRQDCARELEIVIADNHSVDGTRRAALSYEKYFQRLIVVDGGMPGPARNKGALASSGELLFFIDADMSIPDTGFISKASRHMKENKLGIAPAYLSPESHRWIDKFLYDFYNFILYLSQYIVRPLGAQCIICTREAFVGGGGYPEDVLMAEDHDFVLYTSRKFKYGVVPLYIGASVRRMDKEGRLGLAWKYLLSTYYNLVHGPITTPIFEYEFGTYNQHADSVPRVTLYCELYKLWNGWFYKNIGTGFITSYVNQKKALEKEKIFFTENLNMSANIFQANSHSPYTLYMARKHRRKGKKIVFYAHSTAEDLEKQFRVFHFFVPALRRYLSRLYNFADAVVCPTSYNANLLQTKYNVPKNKTVIISNGVDIDKFSFDAGKRAEFRNVRKIPPEQIVVTNVAMAVKRKGISTFINMGKLFPGATFNWFGKVFNVILSPKIPLMTANVAFRGYVSDIREGYLIADIFLFPSHEEVQAISILEAGAAGLAVLVRDIPAYEGWLKDGENCLKARTDEEFREKLAILAGDKPLREKLGKALRAHVVSEHSFEVVGQKLHSLYRELLKS